jgi:hypothetical protein
MTMRKPNATGSQVGPRTVTRARRSRRPAEAAPLRTAVRTRDAVDLLIARWRAVGTEFVVVDERGRHGEDLASGRLDLARCATTLDATGIDATVRRAGYALLDASNVPRAARPLVLGRALTAVQLLRTHSGHPQWVLIEDAQDLLRQPGIPPHALRLDDGGYCLAVRDGAPLPVAASAGGRLDPGSSADDLDLWHIPPTAAHHV